MKKLLIIIILLCSSTVHAITYHPACKEILPLNSDVLDYSGLGNNTTSSSGTHTTNGVFGGGFYMVAASNNNINNGTQLNTYLAKDPAAITIAYWIKHKSGNNNEQIEMSVHNDTSNIGMYITYVPGSRIIVAVVAVATSWAAAVQASSTSTINQETWYHVAVTVSGNTASIYINGVLHQSTAGNRTHMGTVNQTMLFGENVRSGANHMTAIIEEVQIYNIVLSASDIKRIMYGLHPLNK